MKIITSFEVTDCSWYICWRCHLMSARSVKWWLWLHGWLLLMHASTMRCSVSICAWLLIQRVRLLVNRWLMLHSVPSHLPTDWTSLHTTAKTSTNLLVMHLTAVCWHRVSSWPAHVALQATRLSTTRYLIGATIWCSTTHSMSRWHSWIRIWAIHVVIWLMLWMAAHLWLIWVLRMVHLVTWWLSSTGNAAHHSVLILLRMCILWVIASTHSSHMSTITTWRTMSLLSRIVSTHSWRLRSSSISIHALILLLISVSLACIIHFYGATQDLCTRHFLKSAFTFFFHTKFDESVTFWCPCYWVTNNFSLVNWGVNLMERL